MTIYPRPARGGAEKGFHPMSVNVYDLVTARIIAELEKGLIPWEKPWMGTASGAYSRSTGKPYSLLNQLLLRKSGEYLTFNQVRETGGHVRKGEHPSIVVFWRQIPITEQKADGTQEEKMIPLLRYYNVFHIDQTDGVQSKHKRQQLRPVEPLEEAEQLAQDYISREKIRINYSLRDQAAYSPVSDSVILPMREQFNSPAAYYGTLFHELTHSTGHKNRLNRLKTTAHFGNEVYSKEELVAEIGSAALMNLSGIEERRTFRNSAAYIQSWLSALKNDNRLIVSASSQAEKAVNYMIDKAPALTL